MDLIGTSCGEIAPEGERVRFLKRRIDYMERRTEFLKTRYGDAEDLDSAEERDAYLRELDETIERCNEICKVTNEVFERRARLCGTADEVKRLVGEPGGLGPGEIARHTEELDRLFDELNESILETQRVNKFHREQHHERFRIHQGRGEGVEKLAALVEAFDAAEGFAALIEAFNAAEGFAVPGTE